MEENVCIHQDLHSWYSCTARGEREGKLGRAVWVGVAGGALYLAETS